MDWIGWAALTGSANGTIGSRLPKREVAQEQHAQAIASTWAYPELSRPGVHEA